MAKKTVSAAPLVHIPAVADNSVLSKAQKEFNRLTKRIAKLEKTVVDFRVAAIRPSGCGCRMSTGPCNTSTTPSAPSWCASLTAPTTRLSSPRARAKIADLIGFACADPPELDFPEVQPIIEKYSGPPPTQEEGRTLDKQALEMMKVLFSQ